METIDNGDSAAIARGKLNDNFAEALLIAEAAQGSIDDHEILTNNPHGVTKAQVGLANADNTADAAKPVSSAQAVAIAVVQADVDAHEARTDNPHGVTKSQVGLSNADNTSDVNKPVSTAQAAAIAVVQADVDAHEALTNNPHAVTKAQVGLSNVDNTSDASKPISTATQTALDGKVNNTGNETIGGIKTFSSDPLIPDEAYGVGWDGSLEPPTKNAVYDKIESLSAGSGLTHPQVMARAFFL